VDNPDDYRVTDVNTAIKEAGDFRRAQINAGASGVTYLLRRAADLEDVKPDNWTEAQRIEYMTIQRAMPAGLNLTQAMKQVKTERVGRQKEYNTEKATLLETIKQYKANKTVDRAARIAAVKQAIEAFNREYADDGFGGINRRDALSGF
jgi:hypothetical protein